MEEEKSEVKKKEKPKPITVKVVGIKGESALVEWIDEGKYKRAFVPKGKIKDSAVDPAVLAKGIVYGLSWEDFVEIETSPEKIANELRRHGIWRLEDMNMQVLQKASIAINLGDFLNKAQKETKGR